MKILSSSRKWRIGVALVFFLAVLGAFLAGGPVLLGLMSVQFGPALAAVLFDFGWGALAVVLSIVTATVLFGRFYCTAFCPMGILQDGLGWIMHRKKKRIAVPNLRVLRYAVTAAAIVLLLGGSALGFRVLAPFSNFGAIVTGLVKPLVSGHWPAGTWTVAGAVLPLAVIALLVAWKKRIFCTSLCPVGTILGLCAKYGIYQMRVDASCVGCGMCAKACPVDCIDPAAHTVDNERCVRCMNCLAVCRPGSIALSRGAEKTVPSPEEDVLATAAPDPGRRRFLLRSSLAAAGVVAVGMGAGRHFVPLVHGGEDDADIILPPGAMELREFSRQCTSCQLCVAGCPAGIIKPARGRYGAVRVELGEKGFCQYGCTKCGWACPTGALKGMPLGTKRRLRIGMASFNARACRVLQKQEECGYCIAACPTGAITARAMPSGLEIPKLDPDLCIGCGACQAACPTTPKAMTVAAVAKQEFLSL